MLTGKVSDAIISTFYPALLAIVFQDVELGIPQIRSESEDLELEFVDPGKIYNFAARCAQGDSANVVRASRSESSPVGIVLAWAFQGLC